MDRSISPSRRATVGSVQHCSFRSHTYLTINNQAHSAAFALVLVLCYNPRTKVVDFEWSKKFL